MAAQATNVVSLQGKAWAKAEDGSLRELKAGDTIAADEQLVTESGSQIQLDFGDGKLVSLSGAHEVAMSPEMWPETATTNASVLESQFDAILASLDENEALLQDQQFTDILASLDANDGLLQDGRFEAILATLEENDADLQQLRIQDILASLDANDTSLLESRFDDILQSLAQNDRDLNPSEFDVILAGLEQNDQILNDIGADSLMASLEGDGDLLDQQEAPAAGTGGTGGGHDFVRVDRIELPTEGQIYNFAGGFTGNPGNVVFSNNQSSTLNDDGTPDDEGTPDIEGTVIVSLAGPASVIEGETTAAYTVTLSEPVPAGNSVTVNLSYTYVSASGEDIVEVSSVTVTGGNSTATFTLDTLDDFLAEGIEDFAVAVGSVTDTDSSFETIAIDDNNGSVTTAITDQIGSDNPPAAEDTVFAVITGPVNVNEGDISGDFTVSLVDENGNPVTVSNNTDVTVVFSNGTAEVGDYDATAQTVTISAGASSATLTVPTNADADLDEETFTASIDSVQDTGEFENIDTTTGVNGESPDHTITILDNGGTPPGTEDTATVSLVGPTDVVEGEATTDYTLSVDQAAGDVSEDIVVTFTYSGVAVDGSDFTGVASATISAGSNSTTFQIDTLDDALAEGSESFTVSIDNINDNGQFEAVAADASASSVTTTITDASSLSVDSVSSDSQAEGNTLTHTVTLSG
ncbi:Calx-beta domain-containing protein, partial [Gilvimarinus sp. SDUM040013]